MSLQKITLATTLAISLITQPIFAVSSQEMAKVVNLAGRQRMLIQKMTKEVLLVAKRIKAGKNLEELQKTSALFDKTLKGLLQGDTEMGLVALNDPEVTAQLKVVEDGWKNFKPLVEQALKGKTADVEYLKQVATDNMPILKNMNAAVGLMEKVAKKLGGASTDSTLATTINLAGAQRMLSQKMTKELLLISLEVNPEENRKELKNTVDRFDKILKGLKEGDASEGLVATKDSAILSQLGTVTNIWKEYKAILDQVTSAASGSEVRKAHLNDSNEINMKLLVEMNKAVELYEKSAG